MLKSALQEHSQSVTIEVLTYKDLEEMRRERRGTDLTDVESARSTTTNGLVPNNKRYLILTYASEFDRVHYPLPLSFEEAPDPDRLRRVICELRAEIESLRKTPVEENGTQATTRTPESSTAHLKASDRVPLDRVNLNRELKLVRNVDRGGMTYVS